MMSFLNAEWRKLVIINYVVDPKMLHHYVPEGTELDTWKGRCYVSLVGFMFVNTRVMGVPVPFHNDFEEVNLRFYVKYREGEVWKRGVVFIKELVPKSAITFVANTLYKEHYQTVPMTHKWRSDAERQCVRYGWKLGGKEHMIEIKALNTPFSIEEGSEEQFITEHYWGYTKVSRHKTFEYEVTHPKWECYKVHESTINVDFKVVYGKEFDFMNDLSPISVFLAEGSEISVKNRTMINV